jgi:hypothetical protein
MYVRPIYYTNSVTTVINGLAHVTIESGGVEGTEPQGEGKRRAMFWSDDRLAAYSYLLRGINEMKHPNDTTRPNAALLTASAQKATVSMS